MTRRATKPEDHDRWIVGAEAARRLGMSPQALGGWVIRPGAPIKRSGSNVLVEWPSFARWRESELVRQAKAEMAPGDIDESKARKIAAEAALAELELAKARGELLAVDDWTKATAAILDRVRARIVALPGRLAPLVTGITTLPAAVAAIEPVVAEVLAELAAGGPPIFENVDAGDEMAA